MTTAVPVGIADLPNEIICRIVDWLDDTSFCAARAAHRIFCVHSRDEIHSKRRVPRWLAGNPHRYARHGHVEAIHAWKANGHRFCAFDLYCAVTDGNAAAVAAFYDDLTAQRKVDEYDLVIVAVLHGHLDVVRALHECGYDAYTSEAMDLAAGDGHLAIVEFLHENGTKGCTSAALSDAAQCGHLDIVRFLCSNRTESDIADAIRATISTSGCFSEVAAYLVHEYIARDLHSTDQRLGPYDLGGALYLAARAPGRAATIDALAQLIAQEEKDQYWFGLAAKAAAEVGLVDTVRVLVPRCDCRQIEGIIAVATKHGHDNVVRAMLAKDGKCL
ncbi:Ankyrin repeat domain containing protein [Pandoravirus macleodensis]|uniref:Ankyrin repeat domain containing protein n=1 Tax=Pandoravirus macleodensis TaxID=2107707 RepID=A0A2U7UF81_9VIRU|nr:Ankyrin repeat domain containing protein [Pandoravirus macleodensis]AVK77128.1 Ankyrin repeat domain containing protein [Pandoravirus macleodensis]UMO79838.1 Ankyrin repeat domain containing protein [Pandoravirus aubagnensis]